MGIQFKKKQRQSDVKVDYGAAKRTPPRIRWFLIVLLLSLPLLFLLHQLSKEYVFVSFSGMVIFDTVVIRAPQDGFIEVLHVKTGEHISKNGQILKFESPTLDERLSFLKQERKRIQQLKTTIERIKPAKLEEMLKIFEDDIKTSQEVYERFKKYSEQGHLAELQLQEARKNLVTAQRAYAQLKHQIREKSIENKTLLEVHYKRRIEEIDSEIKEIKTKQTYFKMRAPSDGTMSDVMVYQGEFVSAGQALINMVTNQNLRAMAFIDPNYAEAVYQNRNVRIEFPDGETFKGHVVNAPSYADTLPSSLSNPLATKENKLISMIHFDEEIPKKYQVYGIPLEIFLD